VQVYPHVLGELATLDAVVAGASIARYGDGEFKHCKNQRNVSQQHHPTLSRRLRELLVDSGACLVGIPNIHSDTPKAGFWSGHTWAAQYLVDRPYVSAFITRPDSAPWIDTPNYWQRVQSLWVGQDVTLVRGSHKSLTPEDLAGARSIVDVVCPKQHAFDDYDSILARVLEARQPRVIICLGPTATVLAADLCARGKHAVDLGHIALFLRKHRRGEPMWLSKDDKGHDK
jgi:hypothetical protein